jgi:hypothetical protein
VAEALMEPSAVPLAAVVLVSVPLDAPVRPSAEEQQQRAPVEQVQPEAPVRQVQRAAS